jgi:surface carbohydrate biosynthesis protein
MKHKCDILNLEYSSRGRDVDISEPILSYLEIKHNLKIRRDWCFGNMPFLLLKYYPRILLIANGTGSRRHFNAVKLASKLGIKVVALTSEGDFLDGEKKVRQFFWGWNKDRVLYEDLRLVWSQRVFKQIEENITDSDKFNIKISGATGFDRYHFFDFMKKNVFLEKYNKKKYTKVIGLGGWNFQQVLGEYYNNHKDIFNQTLGVQSIKIHQKSKGLLRQIYRKIIENNQDILFILKYHPMDDDRKYSEFYKLDKYQNVLSIYTEENIADIINASDFWIAYESTSCLEAWLLGKQTMLVNPVSAKFNRSIISQGSPIKKSQEEVQTSIDAFYKYKEIIDFKALSKKREKIIKDVIGFKDGKNHIRAAEEIYRIFLNDNINKKANIDIYVIKIYLKCIEIFIKNSIKKLVYRRNNKKIKGEKELFDFKEREYWHEKYKKYLREFYIKKNMYGVLKNE